MKYDFIIEAEEAKRITLESEASYERTLKEIYERIGEAAKNGTGKVLFPAIASRAVEERIKEHLTLLGYKIGWWDATTSNTTIHWV